MYALVEDGAVSRYPFNKVDLRILRRDVSWPVEISDDTAIGFGLVPVAATPRPADDLGVVVEELKPIWVDGVLTQQWRTRPATVEEQQARAAALVAEYTAALDAYLDGKAQEKNYDNRITCMVRAGFDGPYQLEARRFATWVDTCNMQAYQIMLDVQQGKRPPPATAQEFIAELPPFTW